MDSIYEKVTYELNKELLEIASQTTYAPDELVYAYIGLRKHGVCHDETIRMLKSEEQMPSIELYDYYVSEEENMKGLNEQIKQLHMMIQKWWSALTDFMKKLWVG